MANVENARNSVEISGRFVYMGWTGCNEVFYTGWRRIGGLSKNDEIRNFNPIASDCHWIIPGTCYDDI